MFRAVNAKRLNRSGWITLASALLLSTSSNGIALAQNSMASEPHGTVKAGLIQGYGKLPLSFEANRGQADAKVKFIAHGNGYQLYLTGQEAVLTLHKRSKPGPVGVKGRLSANGISPYPTSVADEVKYGASSHSNLEPLSAQMTPTTDVIRMQLTGESAEAVGKELLPGTVNYFRGNDPSKWISAVPTFQKVRYSSVYPGIDLVYYGNQGQLEYDFVVAAGADPKPIQLHFAGAKELKVGPNGSLTITAENGAIDFHKPSIYQIDKGVRQPVDGAFKLLANNTIGFTLGRYDHSKQLVIDPILAYSTYFGGTNAEYVVAVTADASNNAYITGLTISEDFPLTPGAFQAVDYATPTNAVSTAFISKLNPSGTALLYSTYIGGVAMANTLHLQGDYGKAIAVDVSGNAYITGYTYSTDFPTTSGAFQKGNQAVIQGHATGFVTKLNPTGTALVYSTYLGGNTLDELNGIALDPSGDAFISGVSFSSSFPTTPGVVQATNKSFSVNGFNSIVTKMNPLGSGLIYSTYLGGTLSYGLNLGGIYWTNPIVVDKSGNAYVEGFTQSSDFPTTAGALQTANHGGYNVTVSKLNPTATTLLYSTYLGGSTDSVSEGLAVDNSGNAYVAGYTSDIDFPVTKGAFQTVNHAQTNTSTSSEANQNGFVSKINPAGTALIYSTYLGGSTGPWGGDQIYDLAVDSLGNAYVAGSVMSVNFPVTANAYQLKNKGATHCCDYLTYTSDGFLTELNTTGTSLIYSTYLGGSGTQNPSGPGGAGDSAYGITLGNNGNVFVVGFTTSANFPVSAGAFEAKYHTKQNTGFISDFDLGATPTSKGTSTSLTPSANSVIPGTSVTFTAAVTLASGASIPTGNLVFSIDEKTVATFALNSSGKASYSTSTLAPGAHYILASYVGNATYGGSGEGLTEFIVPILPVIAPPGGTYTSQQTVTITSPTRFTPLYYTVNGTAPSIFTSLYNGPLTVNSSRTIKATAIAASDAYSATISATYVIAGSPWVLAEPATGISTPNATLNALVSSSGLVGSYLFQYGLSSTAMTSSTAAKALGASTARVAAGFALTQLKPKTTYYYRVVVTTAGGSCSGAILNFTTN